MKIRIAQNTRQFRLLIGCHRIDDGSGIINHFAIFGLFVINLADVKWNDLLENRIFLQFDKFLKRLIVIAFQVMNVPEIVLCRCCIHGVSFFNFCKISCSSVHLFQFEI